MKITNLKINSFGKLKDKNIDLNDGINIIYGENEAGKSTVLKFITSSLYGINRNKAGKYTSDYEHFTPWEQADFSGKLAYKLDDGSKYEIYRDFTKKAPKVFNENMEDVTKDFTIDKTRGSRFFVDQTGVEEELFLTTIVSEQQAVKLGEKEQAGMVQKMTNILGTGDDNVSYKTTIANLNKKITNDIGTKNTKEKPINLLEKKKKELSEEIKYIERFENEKFEIDENKKEEQALIAEKEKELELAKKVQHIEEGYILDREKLKFLKESEDNQRKIIKDLEEKNDSIEEPNIKKVNLKIRVLFISLLLVIGIIIAVVIKPIIVKIIGVTIPVIIATILLVTYFIKNKRNTRLKAEEENKRRELEKEIKKQEDILEDKIAQNREKESDIFREYQNKKNELLSLVNTDLDKSAKDRIINSSDINEELIRIQEKLNESKLNIHRMELDEQNVLPKLEQLSAKVEELEAIENEYEQLMFESQAIQLAKETVEKAYNEMRNSISPRFTEKLSETIDKISNGKYNKVRLSDEFGLVVENEKGDYIPAEALSVGTIDELYLSLRLATIDDISKEKLPIILDEAFAYFDNTRLENLIKFLKENYGDRQLIIFTCTNRETSILEKNNMDYKLIEL